MQAVIRYFSRQDDIAFAAKLTQQEKWHSETPLEIGIFYENDPNGCFIAEVDHEPVGICIATSYEHNGFIGELIVRKNARQSGIGQLLMETAMRRLHERGIQSIYLDGVVKAVPLYERLGFETVCRSLRLFGQVEAIENSAYQMIDEDSLEKILLLDRKIFGEERGFFLRQRLRHYPELCWLWAENGQVQAYLFARRGIGGWLTVGPWVSLRSPTETLGLLAHFQAAIGNQPFAVGVLESNRESVQLLVQAGLQPNPDPPLRMVSGPVTGLGMSDFCLAIGSPAKG